MTPDQTEQRRRIFRALHPDDRAELNEPRAVVDLELPDGEGEEPADR